MNLINPFEKKLTVQEEIQLLKNSIALLYSVNVQIITAITHFEGYETIDYDFKDIKKVISENKITHIDILNLPECLSSKFEVSQLILYSLNILKTHLIGIPECNNIIN